MADNQESLPQILPHNISPDFCPPGPLWQKLQAYQDEYLSQAVINIPGLGQVTPSEIETINATLVSLQNQIDALSAPERRYAVLPVAVGDSTVAISFSSAMPDNNYDILITLIDDTGASTAASGNWYLVNGTKLAGSMSVRFVNIPAEVTTFEYSVVQRL